GYGNDVLIGAKGDDTLFGDFGSDTVFGGPGNDTLAAGIGYDGALNFIYGGGGDYDEDVVFGSTEGYFILEETGLYSGYGDAYFPDADVEVVYLSGSDGDDYFSASSFSGKTYQNGQGGNDTLLGGDGADRLLGRSGTDFLAGGAGADSL